MPPMMPMMNSKGFATAIKLPNAHITTVMKKRIMTKSNGLNSSILSSYDLYINLLCDDCYCTGFVHQPNLIFREGYGSRSNFPGAIQTGPGI